MADPASINLTLRVTGLDRTEASAVYRHVPAGCRIVADVSQPALGGPRHLIEISGLSSYGARDLTAALAEHLTAIANGDQPRTRLIACPECLGMPLFEPAELEAHRAEFHPDRVAEAGVL